MTLNKIVKTFLTFVSVTFCFFVVDPTILGAKMAALPAVVAQKVAVEYYQAHFDIQLPESKIIAVSFPKFAGQLVILKRVDTPSNLIIDELVAVLHVVGNAVEELDPINALSAEYDTNPGDKLANALEYAIETQVVKNLQNGNNGLLGNLVTTCEGYCERDLFHFMPMLKTIHSAVKFQIIQDSNSELAEIKTKLEKLLENSLPTDHTLFSNEQLRALAEKYYLIEVKDCEDYNPNVLDGVKPRIIKESSLDNGQIEITLDLFGGIAAISFGHEKSFIFEKDGTLVKKS